MNALSAVPSALVLLLALTIAQTVPHGAAADRSFTIAAEEAGNSEVAEGRLAEARGVSSTVRSLGARMVHDHTLAGERLAAVARREGLPVTRSLGADGSREIGQLEGLRGRAFDRAYVLGNVTDHRKAVALFLEEAAHGHDAALRRAAQSTLPMLRLHLSLFESAARSQ